MTWLEESRKVCEAATRKPGEEIDFAPNLEFAKRFNPATVKKMLAVIELARPLYERASAQSDINRYQEGFRPFVMHDMNNTLLALEEQS